jgi:hypothetical protein
MHDLEVFLNVVKTFGFHAFTGNDYVSSFFRKGKQVCWKNMKNSTKFIKAFGQLGESWELKEDSALFSLIEEYTCLLYGFKEKSVDVVRAAMFEKKYLKDGKIVDMAVLPPCESVLFLHTTRANFVAKIWRSSLVGMHNTPSITEHGWNADGSPTWVADTFPDNICEILCETSLDDIDEDLEEDEEYSDNE